MSFPKGLDEYAEEELHKELQARHDKRISGLCDYCGRAPNTKPCRFLERHHDKRIQLVSVVDLVDKEDPTRLLGYQISITVDGDTTTWMRALGGNWVTTDNLSIYVRSDSPQAQRLDELLKLLMHNRGKKHDD